MKMHRPGPGRPLTRRGVLASASAALLGCGRQADNVTVYCALDREFAQPILDSFAQETGIAVAPLFDTESTKTVGLAERLRREQARPLADVFWNNEPLHTVRLALAGVFAAYASPAGRQFPQEWRSDRDLWFGFAARRRTLLVNRQRVPRDEPTTLDALAEPRWRGQVGLAKPLFGTTATHLACLWAGWGAERATAWLRKLVANDAKVLSGNKRVAEEVGAGTLALGLTDTDDAHAELAAGRKVEMTFLQDADGRGGPVLANTMALVANAPRPDLGRRLIDHLLTPAVERKLAAGASRQLPLHPEAAGNTKLAAPDILAAARAWEPMTATVRRAFGW